MANVRTLLKKEDADKVKSTNDIVSALYLRIEALENAARVTAATTAAPGVAGGSNAQVQYNDGGTLAGSADFTRTSTGQILIVATDDWAAGYVEMQTSTGGTGWSGWSVISGAATGNDASGLEGGASNAGTGTLANAFGVVGAVQNTSTGTITNAAALYAFQGTNTGGGAVTNAFGLKIAPVTVGTNNYYVYGGDGSGTSPFVVKADAKMGLGLVAPLTKLHIGDGLITHAGTTGITAFATGGQANAVALTNEINFVTVCATIGDSVKLPTAGLGVHVLVVNQGANACAVFPATGGNIDGIGLNLAYSLAAGASREFWGQSTTLWTSK